MGHWGYGWSWGGMWLGMLLPILFLGLVAWAVATLAMRGARPAATGTTRALEILSERYARGEISVEELHQMRDELNRK